MIEIAVAAIAATASIVAAKVAHGVRAETKPNGGNSLRDQLDRVSDQIVTESRRSERIEMKVDDQGRTLYRVIRHLDLKD